MDGEKIKDNSSTVFRKEYEAFEHFNNVLSYKDLTKEQLQLEFQKLLDSYTSLLKDAEKITNLGDVSQHKLLKAKEKIETLNEKLVESEKNIKELNTILMFYIKATEK